MRSHLGSICLLVTLLLQCALKFTVSCVSKP